jgi:hypothetical protein
MVLSLFLNFKNRLFLKNVRFSHPRSCLTESHEYIEADLLNNFATIILDLLGGLLLN